MRVKQWKRGWVILAIAWLVSRFVVCPCRTFSPQKPSQQHGVGPLLAAANKEDPQGIKRVEETPTDEADALTLARRQLKLAVDQQERAQVQVDMAVEDLQAARRTGDEQKIREAKEEVKEAKEEVKEAEEKVKEANEEVKEAKDEVQEKVNTEATDFANELASTQPQRLDANVELFQLNGFLARDYAKSGAALFSRKATRVAWDAVFQLLEQDKMDRIAMLGMPGIGKSRSLFYGLWRLMTRKVPPVVVFEARRRQKVFIFTLQNNQWVVRSIGTNDWKPGSCKYLQDERNFYLIDAFAPEQWDAILPAKTIKACTPDRRHHSGFVKDGGTYVYVEAWSAEEVKAAHPYLEGAPELTEMLERFEQVGGNLRVLLSKINDYDSYVLLQKKDANRFENFESAVLGDLNTEGAKIMTRLFTYLSPNGRSIAVSFCSEKAKMLVLDKHYDELMKTWSTPNDPRAFYLFEQFAGTIFTSSLLEGRLLEGYSITRSDGGWTYEKCGPLIPGGRQLLECDAEGTFDDRWREAVRKGDLGEVLLHSPDKYPGIDYLLDFNHGIQVTLSENHNIAKTFLDKLEKAFEGQKDYSFTLTFLVVTPADKFKPKSVGEFNALMRLAQDPEKTRVFSSVKVQAFQIPKTRAS